MRGIRRPRRERRMGSVQQGYVSAEAVIGDILVLATPSPARHEYRALLEVSAVNYTLKSEGEQEAILAGYRAFLNGLNFPMQLVIQVRPLDLVSYAERIRAAPLRQVSSGSDQRPSAQAVDPAAQAVQVDDEHDEHDERDTLGQGALEPTQSLIWQRLAEDEARYVLDLAAQKTLLERRFYLVLPSDEHPAVDSSMTSGSGLRLSRNLLPGMRLMPLSRRRRKQRVTLSRALGQAARVLDLRAQNVARELSRIGLDTRRLAGAELTEVYHRSIAPDAARRFPLSQEHLLGTDVFFAGSTASVASAASASRAHSAQPPALSAHNKISGVAGLTELTELVDPAESSEAAAEVGDSEEGANRLADGLARRRMRRNGRGRRGRGGSGSEATRSDAESTDDPLEADDEAAPEAAGVASEVAWGDLATVLAPAAIELSRDDVRLDNTFCRTLAVVGYPRHVYDGWLERLIDLDEPLDVALHLHPQSTAAMIRQLSHRLVQLHSSHLLNEERGRIGSADLGVAYQDVERTRERLQRGDERIFATSLYLHVRAPVATRGPARQLLEERVARLEQELANQQLIARPVTFEQDLGLLSCLPEGRDRLMRTRLLDTSSLATAFPFLSNSLSMPDGILYGITANGSPVFIDTFSPLLENANKVLFAKSGAGKSYACKIEALRSLVRGVDVYVVDPEAEYGLLAEAVGGQMVRLAAGAEQHLNPFDLPQSPRSPAIAGIAQSARPSASGSDLATKGDDPSDASDGGATESIPARHQRRNAPRPLDPVSLSSQAMRDQAADRVDDDAEETSHGAGDVLADKVQSLHALLDLMLADRAPTGTVGLTQREKGLLDRALYEVYRRAGISSDPATHRRPAPLLRDLYEVLESGACGADETHLADRLHRYVYGSLARLFAEPTNVELTSRLVVFDVRDMDAELRPLGLFLIADFIWTRIRQSRRPRLFIIDEAWTLMQYQEGGRFLAGLARRARKYYLGLTTITQDAQDFLSSEHGRTVLANSSVQLLMKQDSSTIDAVTRAFQLSTGERQFLLGCHKGEGLLFAPGGHVALQIGASPLEHQLATTDPRELAERQEERSSWLTRAGADRASGRISGDPVDPHTPPYRASRAPMSPSHDQPGFGSGARKPRAPLAWVGPADAGAEAETSGDGEADAATDISDFPDAYKARRVRNVQRASTSPSSGSTGALSHARSWRRRNHLGIASTPFMAAAGDLGDTGDEGDGYDGTYDTGIAEDADNDADNIEGEESDQ